MTQRITRRAALAGALATPLLLPRTGWAQAALPPVITLIVGATPGGTTDTLAREVSEPLREKLGRNVVVENRAGAGGNVAATAVTRAAPDGGTLLIAYTSHTLNTVLMRSVPYRPLEDFSPVALLAQLTASVLVVGPSVQERDLAAFVAAARARPDRYSFAIGGVGSSLQMQTVLFRSALGLSGPEVPFRGTSPALVDVVAGHVDAMFAPMDVAAPLMREGKVRPIAVTSDRRVPAHPEVPPMRDAVPEARNAAAWFGVLGPAGMAPPVVAALNAAIIEAMRLPRIAERVALGGGESPPLSPEAFREFLVRDLALWRDTARIGRITPE
ncbi:Bug family tripartite tricarboxylate transporter substrate binding protein [Muricoccus radiodurans]|uniref:Bug family tripartite tricarboxylate transporter substrate binding protein n=1 Tax=Muricoccus radiodurans TaxID=2231721 RepID=UPI003CF248E4